MKQKAYLGQRVRQDVVFEGRQGKFFVCNRPHKGSVYVRDSWDSQDEEGPYLVKRTGTLDEKDFKELSCDRGFRVSADGRAHCGLVTKAQLFK
jgi:hypothetical protein